MATRKKTETDTNKTETVKAAKTETGADKIWKKIADLPIDIFALPNQVVQQHAQREVRMEKVDPNAVHLILKSAAVRPALEESLGRLRLGNDELGQPLVFEVTNSHKYTVVKIVPRDI